MNVAFCYRHPRKFSGQTQRRLLVLTLEGTSRMRDHLQYAIDGECTSDYVAITARDVDTGVIVGWSLIAIRPRYAWVMVFVDFTYRMNGIGRSLIERAKTVVCRRTPLAKIDARPWNSSSTAFFRKCGFKISRDPDYNSQARIR